MSELVDSFMRIMGDQPLSLALVVVVLLLLYIMNKQFNAFSQARKDTSEMIIKWQEDTQKIMADCVSKESLAIIVNALERDRELYRQLLSQQQTPPPN